MRRQDELAQTAGHSGARKHFWESEWKTDMNEVQRGKHVDHAAATNQSAIKQEAPKLSPSTELQTTAEDLLPCWVA